MKSNRDSAAKRRESFKRGRRKSLRDNRARKKKPHYQLRPPERLEMERFIRDLGEHSE